MSTVIEVSEGLPQDGRVFELPPINEDLSRPRYVAFLGNMIEPDVARSRPWTRLGGIEVTSPCLRVVKNFLRQGRITPVLRDHHDYLPYDLVKKTTDVDPLGAGYFAQVIPKGYIPPASPPATGVVSHGFGSLAVGGPSPYGNMVGRLALPGEQIHRILNGEENVTRTNIRKGVVELTALAGFDYKPEQVGDAYVDPEIWEMQRAIFPDYPRMPVLLDDVARLLDEAKVHSTLRPIIDEFQQSLNQFRGYASMTIQNTHTQRDALRRSGYAWEYAAIDLVLLPQLGLERQDGGPQMGAQGDGELREILKTWLTAQAEEKAAHVELLKAQLNANTMAAAPINEAPPVEEPAKPKKAKTQE